jgi:CRISPR-associated protein Csa1
VIRRVRGGFSTGSRESPGFSECDDEGVLIGLETSQCLVEALILRRVMFRSIRRLYELARADPVDPELRGWSWDRLPLKPRAYLNLGVSEIASKYCETRRDIWLRRKTGARAEPTEPILTGRLIHDAISLALKETAKLLINNTEPYTAYQILSEKWRKLSPPKGYEKTVEKTYKATLITILGEAMYEKLVNETPQPVAYSEYRVDGTPLGLSQNLSVDVISDSVIIDFKTGAPRDFHKLSVTGYALALEAAYETPRDYGLLIYVNNPEDPRITYKPVYISNTLRRLFIEERDNIIDMLLEDAEPPRDLNCQPTCPLHGACSK